MIVTGFDGSGGTNIVFHGRRTASRYTSSPSGSWAETGSRHRASSRCSSSARPRIHALAQAREYHSAVAQPSGSVVGIRGVPSISSFKRTPEMGIFVSSMTRIEYWWSDSSTGGGR